MQTNYKGTILRGTPNLATSIANQELIADGRVLNMAFQNTQGCVVVVNNGDQIYLRENQGLFVAVCNSFKITTSGVNFNWVAVLG